MLDAYVRDLRSFDRNVRLYLISGALVGFTTAGGIYTVLLNLYILRLGYGFELVGMVNAAGAIAYALFCLPAGAMGKRFGTRRVMLFGMVLITVGNGMLPLAEFVAESWRAHWLVLARVPRAIGFAMYLVNAAPFLIAATDRARRHRVFSVQAALQPLAAVAGSVAGGLLPGLFALSLGVDLDQPAPYRYPLILATILLIPAIGALMATREVDPPTGSAPAAAGAAPIPIGAVICVAVVAFLVTVGVAVVQTFFNVYMDDGLQQSTALIGLLSAAAQLVSGVAALASPFMTARWGKGPAIAATSVAMAVFLLPMAFIPSWVAVGIGCIGVFAMGAMRFSVFTVFQQEMVPDRWRPTISGATAMATGLSYAAVALGGGYLIPAYGYGAVFTLSAVAVVAGALLFQLYFRIPRGQYARRRGE
jgi:MFS family permease